MKECKVAVLFDEAELLPGDSLPGKIGSVISSNDFLFVLLSRNYLAHNWPDSDVFRSYLDELTIRNVAIIPVLADDCPIPSSLSWFQTLDVRRHSDREIRNLVRQIVGATRIDFSCLTPEKFEKLVSDLLQELEFEVKFGSELPDKGFDFIAEYTQTDPFGLEQKQVWVVQVKFYFHERAGISTLRQLIGGLWSFPKAKGLLITSGQLTSYTKKYIEVYDRSAPDIRVIEGPELKKLLLRFPRLVKRYFPQNARRGL